MQNNNNEVQVINNTYRSINVYDAFIRKVPSTNKKHNAYDYWPTYTLLAVVPARSSSAVSLIQPVLSKLVLTDSSDEFPILTRAVFSKDDEDDDDPPPLTLEKDHPEDNCDGAWSFYNGLRTDIYHPRALQYNQIIKTAKTLEEIEGKINKLIYDEGFRNFGFKEISLVSFWAYQYLYAYTGTYYVYHGADFVESDNILMQNTLQGIIEISENTAVYTPTGKASQPLFYSYGVLNWENHANEAIGSNENPADDLKGLTLLFRELNWEGREGERAAFFIGAIEENGRKRPIIAQPYPTPNLPWWVIAYDMAYAGFYAAEIGMMADMALHLAKSGVKAAVFLVKNAGRFCQFVSSKLASQGKVASSFTSAEILGKDITPIDTDVDIDTVIDTEIDTVEVEDIDTVVDTDTEIDVDTVIDIDDDIFAVIDIDVDTIIDVNTVIDIDDVDVVNIDTEIDTVVDTDIDTSIASVVKGTATLLLKSVGKWLWNNKSKIIKEVLKNVVITFAFQGVEKLLQAWKGKVKEELADLSPQDYTGLGLLINYMLTTTVPIKTRWTIFSDFAEQSEDDIDMNTSEGKEQMKAKLNLQMMALGCILMAPTDKAKTKLTKEQEESLIAEMAKYKTPSDQHKAYSDVLANYKISGEDLPVKIGSGAAKRYLTKIIGEIK